MRRFLCLVFVAGCQWFVETPKSNVCLSEHVAPLVNRDCAACHEQGEFGVELIGTEEDFEELMRYISPGRADGSPLLDWAAGLEEHPVIWDEESDAYNSVAGWINEGPTESCFDREKYGACRAPTDCFTVSCICWDFEVKAARSCYVSGDTSVGTCASPDNCGEPIFGLCKPIPTTTTSTSGEPPPPPPPPDVHFEQHIVPIHSIDCARCHSRGEYNVRIVGRVSDYPEVMRYVDVNDPEGRHGWLWWAAGGRQHPVSWYRGGPQYNLFLEWVKQGAKND